MKVLVLVLILVVCSCIGILLRRRYVRKATFMKDLRRFCSQSMSSVSFNHSKVDELIDNIRRDCGRDFSRLMDIYKVHLDSCGSKKQLFEDINKSLTYLSSSEALDISNFLFNIGHSDTEGEMGNYNNYNAVFDSYVESADMESKKMGPLCVKLGVIVGVFLIIVLI